MHVFSECSLGNGVVLASTCQALGFLLVTTPGPQETHGGDGEGVLLTAE